MARYAVIASNNALHETFSVFNPFIDTSPVVRDLNGTGISRKLNFFKET